MPGHRLFVSISSLEDRGFVKRFTRELKTDRQARGAETTRQGERREPGEVTQRRVDGEFA